MPTCRVQQLSTEHCSLALQMRRSAVGQGSPPRSPHPSYHRGWPAPAFHQLLFFLCRTGRPPVVLHADRPLVKCLTENTLR